MSTYVYLLLLGVIYLLRLFLSRLAQAASRAERWMMACMRAVFIMYAKCDDVEISKRVRHYLGLNPLSFLLTFLVKLILGLGQHSDRCLQKQILPRRSLPTRLMGRLARTFVVSYVFLTARTAPADQCRVLVYFRSMLLTQDNISFESDMMM